MDERVSMEITGEGRVITIKAKRLWPIALFLLAWVSLWTFGGYEAVLRLLGFLEDFKPGNLPFIIFFVIWLTGWLAGEAIAVAGILWFAAGREVITIAQGEMKVVYRLLLAGPVFTYNINEITSVRAEKNMVGFKYRGRNRAIGVMLAGDEPQKLLGYLRECLPQGRFV